MIIRIAAGILRRTRARFLIDTRALRTKITDSTKEQETWNPKEWKYRRPSITLWPFQRENERLTAKTFKIRFIGQRLVPTNMFTKEMTSESCQPLQPRQQLSSQVTFFQEITRL